MASHIDDLVERLLFDIAITGSKGLGAEKIDSTIQYRHGLLSLDDAVDRDVNNSNGSSFISPPDLAAFKVSVWKRLQEHPECEVEFSDGDVTLQVDGAGDGQALQSSDATEQTPVFIHASKDRIWHAIAGHAVDKRRVPPMLFEILEVVAAAGQEGILQPEVRRITDQDKHSIPARTDKLADRGYITKERVAVPRMTTSRLRLWRFATDESGNASDVPRDNEWFDHAACFEKMIKLLQDNDGTATMKDVQLETQCTVNHKLKALSRCITRLEKRGLLRKVMAKVQGENIPNGSDSLSRSLQLLRQPDDFDRRAVHQGGPVKLDSRGRTRTQPASEHDSSHVGYAKDLDEDSDAFHEDDPGELSDQQQPLDDRQFSSVSKMAGPSTDNVGTNGDWASLTPRARSSSAAPTQDGSSLEELAPPSKKRRISSSQKTKADRPVKQANPASSFLNGTPNVEKGVYFRPPSPSPHKRKRGRPRKTLIAVFKSDRLVEQPWFGEESAPDAAPITASDVSQHPVDRMATAYSQEDAIGHAPAISSLTTDTVSLNAPELASVAPVAVLQAANKDVARLETETSETLSKKSLAQRRRWEKVKAQKTAKAQEAALETEVPASVVAGQTTSEGHPPKKARPELPAREKFCPAETPRPQDSSIKPGPALPPLPLDGTELMCGQPHKDRDGLPAEAPADLPALHFIPFEDEAYANAPTKWTHKKRIITKKYPMHEERCNLLLSILRTAGGAFPGVRQMYHAFVSKWQQAHSETPETRTVGKIVETMRKDGRLNKYEFKCKHASGGMQAYHIFTEPYIDISSPQLTVLQKKMIDALPRAYFPDGVEISDRSRKPTGVDVTPEQAGNHLSEPSKQSCKITELSSDAEFFLDGDDSGLDDEDEDLSMPGPSGSELHDWRENFARIDGVSVKRTAAGTEHASNQPTKKRGGWPKGVPRGPRKKNLPVDIDTGPLLSLLFHPRQIFWPFSGTFGSVGFEADLIVAGGSSKPQAASMLIQASAQTPATTPKPMPSPAPPAKRAAAYNSPAPYEDPDGNVSTDYVNRHPEETWYHRGHGRWNRGLPPVGSSYKVAVKGPGAAAYLSSIKTAEGKAKKHGDVIDGVQMKRNGEPWKKQPATVNGVRIRAPNDNAVAPPPVARPRSSSVVKSVPPVQYDVLPPLPPHSSVYNTTAGMSSQLPIPTAPNSIAMQQSATKAARGLPMPSEDAILPPTPKTANTPRTSQPSIATKRKRPYTYKSRKQLSAVGTDGVPIELDRDSDEDYMQQGSSKKQRKQAPANDTPTKAKHSIDRIRLSMAVALVKNLISPKISRDIRWDLVGSALQSNDSGAAAEKQYRSITNSAAQAQFVADLQAAMQEPFLKALEKGELGPVNLNRPTDTDWTKLLRWAENTVVPLASAKGAPSAYDANQMIKISVNGQKAKTRVRAKAKKSKPIVDTSAVFPATYSLEATDKSLALDLREEMITAKSWIRANSATKNEVYDTSKATQKLTAIGPAIIQAVQEMQQTNSIRQLKSGRQRPGRNFEITQHVWEQFVRWHGDFDGHTYLRDLADARIEIMQHFAKGETLAMTSEFSEQKSLVLSSLLAQGMLEMEVRLPPRNDDIDAPGPKLNVWSYCGPRHDTRKIERSTFDLPVVYSKTAVFSAEHSLRVDVTVPGLPQCSPNEALPRVPFWIDIHGNLIPEIWEMVLSSVIFLLMRKPGIAAKAIEKAHANKLWEWEIEVALEWMEKVGIAVRFGGGEESNGVWKGGWTVGDEWYCALTPEVATWR